MKHVLDVQMSAVVRNITFGAKHGLQDIRMIMNIVYFPFFCFEGTKESINDVTGNYLNFPIRGIQYAIICYYT